MSITNKLINPTPFDVKFPYGRTEIPVPADGMVSLTMEQVKDFTPGEPGFEEIRIQLEYFGLFVLNPDKTYDAQALAALEGSAKQKGQQLEDMRERTINARLRDGKTMDEGSLQQILDRAGYGNKGLQGQIDKLRMRAELLRSKGITKAKQKDQLDPRKTCFGLDKPREFASETALEMFLLDQTPEIISKHKEIQEQVLNAE